MSDGVIRNDRNAYAESPKNKEILLTFVHDIARACLVSLFGVLCGTERSFSSTVRSGKVGVRH